MEVTDTCTGVISLADSLSLSAVVVEGGGVEDEEGGEVGGEGEGVVNTK